MPELVIHDGNFQYFIGDGQSVIFDGEWRMLSCQPRKTVYGAAPNAVPLVESIPLIPRSEWDARIAERDTDKSWAYDALRTDDGSACVIKCKDQNGLGYCWAYSGTLTVEVNRYLQGLGYIELAPESLGWSVNWRNRGNSIDAAESAIVQKGICAQSFLPSAHSLSPGSWKAGWEADALKHRITLYDDLDVPGQVFDACVTCALLGRVYEGGFAWWSHAVCGGFKVRKQNGIYQILYRNSWSPTYGEDGFFWMTEGRGTPSIGAFAPRQTLVA